MLEKYVFVVILEKGYLKQTPIHKQVTETFLEETFIFSQNNKECMNLSQMIFEAQYALQALMIDSEKEKNSVKYTYTEKNHFVFENNRLTVAHVLTMKLQILAETIFSSVNCVFL